MLFLRIWNYMRGYVIILVEGYFLEKFINICTHRQIFLWDIHRRRNCEMTFKVSINGFKMLRPVAHKSNCKVRILRKRGLPFVLNRYKKRKTFVLGAILFIVLFYVMTSFVWSIEITGNNKIETEYIIEKLSENGIRTGILKFKIDTDKIVNEMMLEIKELSWMSVSLRGTKIKIQLAEWTEPPELVQKDIPCNIVARRDGVISSIIVKEGQNMVKVGDTVTKGQVLISGSIGLKGDEQQIKLVHALGSVEARTWYEYSCPVELSMIEKERTGRKKDQVTILLFGKKIKLFQGKIDFEDYDKIDIKKQISMGKDMVLPFEIDIQRYFENEVNEKQLELEEAKEIAADCAYKKAVEDIPETAEIVKTHEDYSQDTSGELTVKITVECLEDIGTKEKIGGEY